MISSLIEQAKLLLNSTSDPSLESLEQAETRFRPTSKPWRHGSPTRSAQTISKKPTVCCGNCVVKKAGFCPGLLLRQYNLLKANLPPQHRVLPNRQRQQVDQLKSNFHHQRNSAQRQPHQFWEIFQPVPLRRSPGRTSGQTTWAGSTTIP